MIRDNDWYNLNQQRSWPLDESCSLRDDSGSRLPEDLLVDLSLVFDKRLGRRAAVSSFYVGPQAVSLVIAAVSDGQPLAAITLRQEELQPGRNYPLQSLHASAAGFVAFGGGVKTREGRWQFSTATAAMLMPRTARGVSCSLVTGVRRKTAKEPLTGSVRLAVGGDLALQAESLLIDGYWRQAVTFNLINAASSSERNVMSLYAGDCAARPESKTCPNPQPIEAIGNVQPNCCGQIFLEFRGCVEVGAVINDTGGMVLDCGQSQADVCVSPQRLPDEVGRLPNEYADLCEDKTDTLDLAVRSVSRDPATGKKRISLAEPLPTSLPAGSLVTLADAAPDSINGDYVVLSPIAGGGTDFVVDSPWTVDGDGGRLIIISTPEPPPPNDPPPVPGGRTGLPWSYSFCTFGSPTNLNMWQVVRGGFALISGEYGYNGLGGNLGSITPDPEDASASTGMLEVSHELTSGDMFWLAGCDVAGYNGLHVVREVEAGSGYLVLETPWTADATQGSWAALASPRVNSGGAVIGRVLTIVDNGAGSCLFTLGEDHTLLPSDTVTVYGSSVSGYNVRHQVITVRSGAAGATFTSNIAFTAAANGGFYCAEKPRGGGRITAITSGPDGNLEFTTAAAHGLQVGDSVIAIGTESGLGYDTLYAVVATPSSTKFVGAWAEGGGYTEDSAQPAIWLLVGGYAATCVVWQTNAVSRNVAIFRPTVAGVGGWHGWNFVVDIVLRLRAPGAPGRLSGGLVLDYTTEIVAGNTVGSYWFVELNKGAGDLLYIWHVTISATAAGMPYETPRLISTHTLTRGLTINVRYLLSAGIRPWAENTAELTILLRNKETNLTEVVTVILEGYTGLGVFGLAGNQAVTDFETVSVRELSDG